MNRTQTIALAAVILFAALVALLALRSRQPPVLPADRDHARFVNPVACMTCHANFKPPNHPIAGDGAYCRTCHQ